LRRRLSNPLFSDISIDRAQLQEWMSAAPESAQAFAKLYDAYISAPKAGDDVKVANDPVRQEIERWNGYFADLDVMAEELADELRLGSNDIYGMIAERLRVKHQIIIRILPHDVMPDILRRLDLHARQLQIVETLSPASRLFALASQLGQLEASGIIENMVKGAGFDDRVSDRLFRRHLTSYFAAALIMPYSRFMKACENSGYDVNILQSRFGASFEMVAHRLTTLQRVGNRGLPFFMIRIDRAGQVSKRYSGASNAALIEGDARCPLWNIHDATKQSGRLITQWLELEDGTKWFSMSYSVYKNALSLLQDNYDTEFTISIGVKADFAAKISVASGIDIDEAPITKVGLGCENCSRVDCLQRSLAPANHLLVFNERERAVTPFSFSKD